MSYHHTFEDTLKAMAFVKITQDVSSIDPQLMEFMNFDNSIGDELGVESFNEMSPEDQASLLKSKLNIEDMESETIKSFMDDLESDVDYSSEDLDLKELDEAEMKLDRVLAMHSAMDYYVSTKSNLLAGTYLENIGTESINSALESLSTVIQTVMGGVSKAFGMAVDGIKRIASIVEEKIQNLITKIKALIEKMRNKTVTLKANMRAHPIKTILVVAGTIAAVAGIIYIYSQYNKGYNDMEISQYVAYTNAKANLDELKREQARIDKMIREGVDIAQYHPDELKIKIRKAEEELAKWASEKRELFARMKNPDLPEEVKSRIHRELADKSNQYKAVNAELHANKTKLDDPSSTVSHKKLSPTEITDLRWKELNILNKTHSVENTLRKFKYSWTQPKKSMKMRIDRLCHGTFLQTKDTSVDLKNGTSVPLAEFNQAFPPKSSIIQDSASFAKFVVSHNPELVISVLVLGLAKLGASIKDFMDSAKSTGSNKFNRGCVRNIFQMLKDLVVRCVSFISSAMTPIAHAFA